MGRRVKVAPDPERPVMVRVAANRLGRNARCAVPGCGGELRVEVQAGYPVDICTRCELRVQRWSVLLSRLQTAERQVQALTQQGRTLGEQLRAAQEATPGERPAHQYIPQRNPSTVPNQVLAVLRGAKKKLSCKEIKTLLPHLVASRIGVALHYMTAREAITATPLPGGRKLKYLYSVAA